MKVKRKQAVMLGLIAVFAVLLAITMLTGKPSADGEYTSTVYATALSLLPPVIAIGLALLQRGIYITSGRNSGWSTFVCQWQSGINVKYDAI